MAQRRPTESTANPVRGAVLVVAAVVIGLFLLRNGITSSTSVSEDPGSQSTDQGTDEGTTDDGTDEGTTDEGTITPTVREPAEVRVIVLNDSGVTGAAGTYSGALGDAGYQLVNENGANSSRDGDAPATEVLYTAGFDQEAALLATQIGAPASGVGELGTVSPGDIGDANVIVVLGTDIAGTTPSIPDASTADDTASTATG